MPVIEITTFRLASGAEEAAFLAADQRVQTDFAYQQPGIVRRTTARGADDWATIELWRAAEHADAAAARRDADPAVREFTRFVDPASVTTRRYTSLD